jgi:elongation factor P
MPKVDTSEMRPGTRVELDGGEPFLIIDYQHVKPGKGGAFVRLKLKSLASGAVLDRTIKGGDSLELADVTDCQMQYLYADGANRVFMDKKTYEQVEIPVSLIESADLLTEGLEVGIVLHKGKPIDVELPQFVELAVAETDPPEKGGKLKPAVLETGVKVRVPSFIQVGDRLKVDTRERAYVARA